MFTAAGLQNMPTPWALATGEGAGVVDEFRHAASAAIAAGFDGWRSTAPTATWSTSSWQATPTSAPTATVARSPIADRRSPIADRIRFAVEVASAVADEIGAERTGLRISPGNPYNDIAEHDTRDLYPALVTALAPLSLAYLHLTHGGDEELLRQQWPTALFLNRAGADIDTRVADLDAGLADVITVGTTALANPDLPARLRSGAPLNQADPATFYGGDHRGCTDYLTLAAAAASGANHHEETA
jgi:N-ethylmaleimide reductase